MAHHIGPPIPPGITIASGVLKDFDDYARAGDGLHGSIETHFVGVAQEDIPAGAMCEIDMSTGRIRRAKPR